jgi:ABC-type ATPase with predicted acetyltransferase domain
MRYVTRKLGTTLQVASRHFPAVVITGPRRAGKATLLRQLFPKARYVLLEDPDTQGRIRGDRGDVSTVVAMADERAFESREALDTVSYATGKCASHC